MNPKPAGAQDGAMLAVAFAGGLRLDEIVNLDYPADVNGETGELVIRQSKGNKDRTAYLQHGALAALCDWLSVRKLDAGPLFCPVSQKGKITIRRLSGQAAYERFQLRARQAGLSTSFSPHDGRRTWIGNLLDAGVDIATVQQMAGHELMDTTARYDRRGREIQAPGCGPVALSLGERSS
jgi:integrase/recombinase XerD